MLNAIQTALSGLNAASKRVQSSAENIANSRVSGALEPQNGPEAYQASESVQSTNGSTGGVSADIIPKERPTVTAYDPDSPFANAEGQVAVPNVNLAEEAVNLIFAEISYKANLSVIETTSELSEELLNIFSKDV